MSNSTQSNSWLKLYHKFLEWEWYQDINTSRLFIHILLKTNYKDKKWRGEIIKRGSFITSLENLSKETGLSVQQVRTSLTKLKSTHEITYLGTREYSKITINNYSTYQPINTPDNKQSTDHQHTSNTPLTTTIERYKDRKIDNISKDIDKSSSYGNKDINTCMDYLKERVGGQLDGTEKNNRQYCYNLIRKIKKGYPELDPVEQVQIIIDVAIADAFHSKNATSFKYLYYNFVRIIKQAQGNTNKVAEIK